MILVILWQVCVIMHNNVWYITRIPLWLIFFCERREAMSPLILWCPGLSLFNGHDRKEPKPIGGTYHIRPMFQAFIWEKKSREYTENMVPRDRTKPSIQVHSQSVWWFGTCFIFPEILRMSSSQLTNSNLFQRGWNLNHQPAIVRHPW